MDALKVAIGASLLLVPDPVTAEPLVNWRPFVSEAARRFALPEAWVMRVIRAESADMTHIGGRPIRSRVGAMGLMQLMPATWAAMRQAHGLGGDPDDPRDNILAGTAYLRMMYDRFGYPGLFGAYNAGPGRYAAHRATGAALPLETRIYMAKTGGVEAPVAAAPALADGTIRAIYEAPPLSVFALSPPASERASPLAVAPTDEPVIFAIRKVIP